MEPAAPILEQIFMYAGHTLCIAGALYMLKVGEIKVGLALLVGFSLQIQAGILVGLIDSDMEAQGACWASGRSYYECLPIWFRVTIHLGQLGIAMVGVGVFLAAMALRRSVANS